MRTLGGAPGLCLLALRRGLAPGLLALFLFLAAVLVGRDPLGNLTALPLDAERLEAADRALQRHAVLAVLGGLALAWTCISAALAGARWRAAELDWLAPRGTSRTAVAIATWLGTWFAGCALILAAVLAAEFAAGEGPPALTPVATLGGPRVLLLPGAAEARWEFELPPGTHGPDERLRASVAPTFGGGRAADVRLVLERATGAGRVELATRVAAPTSLTLPLPSGTGSLVATLAREGGTAAIALTEGGLTLLRPSPSERLASLSVALALALAAGALAALSLGLASWMRAGLALLLVAALLLVLTVHGAATGLLAELGPPRALEVLRGGLVPRLPTPAAVASATLVAGLGLCLTCLGRASVERAS